jgi:hypothetical protein
MAPTHFVSKLAAGHEIIGALRPALMEILRANPLLSPRHVVTAGDIQGYYKHAGSNAQRWCESTPGVAPWVHTACESLALAQARRHSGRHTSMPGAMRSDGVDRLPALHLGCVETIDTGNAHQLLGGAGPWPSYHKCNHRQVSSREQGPSWLPHSPATNFAAWRPCSPALGAHSATYQLVSAGVGSLLPSSGSGGSGSVGSSNWTGGSLPTGVAYSTSTGDITVPSPRTVSCRRLHRGQQPCTGADSGRGKIAVSAVRRPCTHVANEK